MKNVVHIVTISLLSLLLSGCLKQVNVTSNTFANNNLIPYGFPVETSFHIASNTNNNPLFLREVEEKISQQLQDKGHSVTSPENAEYHLMYSCGLTSTKEVVNTPRFIPGSQQVKVGAGHSHTSGSIHSGYDVAHLSGSGSTHYREKTTNSGSIVYVPETVIVFTHRLHIEIYRVKSFILGRNNELVWQGTAASCESSGDQRDILDYLLSSVFKHFGKSTTKHAHESHVEWL